MDLEYLANIATILSLPISIIALFLGGGAWHKVKKYTINNENVARSNKGCNIIQTNNSEQK